MLLESGETVAMDVVRIACYSVRRVNVSEPSWEERTSNMNEVSRSDEKTRLGTSSGRLLSGTRVHGIHTFPPVRKTNQTREKSDYIYMYVYVCVDYVLRCYVHADTSTYLRACWIVVLPTAHRHPPTPSPILYT